MEVGITRIREGIELPEYKTEGAACFDIPCAEGAAVEPGETAYIPTGLVFQTPPGHALIMVPRSSMPKTGLLMTNCVGIMDEDFRGPTDEIKIMVKNISESTVTVEKGQRLVQGFFMKIDHVAWKELKQDEITQKSRGGIGTTGK